MLQIKIGDSPVENYQQDLYGIDTFAKSIVNCLRSLNSPVGTVLAINGIWGSGKTSVLNMIRADLDKRKDIVHSEFKCWWFRSDEEIIISFINHLGTVLKNNFGENIKTKSVCLFRRYFSLFEFAADVGRENMPSWANRLVSLGMKHLGKELFKEKTLEDEFNDLAKELRAETINKKILIVIDDIDRLAPNEMMTIFRLVKTVGQLPGIIFLLAFDKNIANQVIENTFHVKDFLYLEKIVQASFDIPVPFEATLEYWLYSKIRKIMEIKDGEEISSRFSNAYLSFLKKYIKTPRNVERLVNSISITWPAIKNEIDPVDFIVLETIRNFDSELFAFIANNWEKLVNFSFHSSEINALLKDRRDIDNDLIDFLFNNPDAFKNLRQRRICIAQFLTTYFLQNFTGYLPYREVETLIHKAGDVEFLKKIFIRDKASKTTLYLDSLIVNVNYLDGKTVIGIVKMLIDLYDKLSSGFDGTKSCFSMPTDLCEKYVVFFEQALKWQKLTIEDLSKAIMSVAPIASLPLLAKVGLYVLNKRYRIFSTDGFSTYKQLYLNRVCEEKSRGSLINYDDLPEILLFWIECDDLAQKQITDWVEELIQTNENILILIKIIRWFLNHGKTAMVKDYMQLESIIKICNQLVLNENLCSEKRVIIEKFLASVE